LWIVTLLIVALVIGWIWSAKWFALWRGGGKADATVCPSKWSRLLKPRTPEDCPACRGGLSGDGTGEAAKAMAGGSVTPNAQVNNSHGRTKRLHTAGYACPNTSCAYFGVTDESIHALVHCGGHGKHERIADLKCVRPVGAKSRCDMGRPCTA